MRFSKFALTALALMFTSTNAAAPQGLSAIQLAQSVEAVTGLRAALERCLATGSTQALQALLDSAPAAAKSAIAEQMVAYAVAYTDRNKANAALIAAVGFGSNTLAVNAPNTADAALLVLGDPAATALLQKINPSLFNQMLQLAIAGGGTALFTGSTDTRLVPTITLPNPAQSVPASPN